MKRTSRARGYNLMEVLVAMGLTATVLAAVYGVVVSTTKSFSREQGQTYTQFRVRTTLDDVAKDIREASEVTTATGLPGGVSASSALALKIPSKNAGGIMFDDPTKPSADTVKKDTVIYFIQGTGQNAALYRKTTIQSGSLRTAGTQTMAKGVTAFTFAWKNAAGAATNVAADTVAVDVSATVGDAAGAGGATVALTGVRMRNKIVEN